MADLYRKASLERLSNPEQLDRAIIISKPLSWLALIGAALVIVVTIVWAFVGKLPTTTTVEGVITGTTDIGAVYSEYTGKITSITKTPGDTVKAGDEIAKIKLSTGKTESIKATEAGTISQLLVAADGDTFAGSEVARLTPKIDAEQVVVCYAPAEYAQKIEEGMTAQIYMTSVDSQKYGHMEAEVKTVGQYPVNTANLGFVLGTNNLMAERFASNGPVVSIVLELKKDSSTISGFYWSNKNGKNISVQNGVFVSGKIVIDESAPINKLFKNKE